MEASHWFPLCESASFRPPLLVNWRILTFGTPMNDISLSRGLDVLDANVRPYHERRFLSGAERAGFEPAVRFPAQRLEWVCYTGPMHDDDSEDLLGDFRIVCPYADSWPCLLGLFLVAAPGMVRQK